MSTLLLPIADETGGIRSGQPRGVSLEDQIKWEAAAINQGIENYRKEQRDRPVRGSDRRVVLKISETSAGRQLIREAIAVLAERISQEQ
jgi:hypothetical protein